MEQTYPNQISTIFQMKYWKNKLTKGTASTTYHLQLKSTMGFQVTTNIVEFPIRGETKGVGNKGLHFRARLPLGVPHHQDVVSPLAGQDSRISRGRPGNRLGVSCLHAVDSLLNLLLPDVDQLQGRRYYEASDQIHLYSKATRCAYIASDHTFI